MICIDDASCSFDGAAAVDGVTLRVRPGERVAVVGANGSGKSTLLRLACGLVEPDSGTVAVLDGDGTRLSRPEDLRCAVGLVQQDPRDQIVSSLVADEVAFGPCNLGLPPAEVESRLAEALSAVGLEGFGARSTGSLSGGEQQRLALAGVLAMRPRYLALDEAGSMLDASSRAEMRATVDRLARERGVGILSVSHDPLDVLGADRVAVMDGGRIAWEGPSAGFLARTCPGGTFSGVIAQDPYVRFLVEAGLLGEQGAADAVAGVPLLDVARVAEHVRALSDGDARARALAAASAMVASAKSAARGGSALLDGAAGALALEGVRFSYGEAPALDGLDLRAEDGHVLLVAGASGSGKSTMARVAAGLYEPDAGTVLLAGGKVCAGDVGIAFQRPEDQLFCETVRDDIGFGLRERGFGADEVADRVEAAAARLGIDAALLDRSPYELSGGYARRAALASLVAAGPGAYVFDEPTVGLDLSGRSFLHEEVARLARGGAPVVVVSHDVAEWLHVADEVAFIADGAVVWRGAAAGACRELPYESAGMLAPEFVRLAEALGACAGGGAL